MTNFDEFFTDLDSEPITGWLHTGEHIDLPLISHIVDNLYVGGHSTTADLGDFFSHVFSLYPWDGRYKFSENASHFELAIYDSPNEDPTKVSDFVDMIGQLFTTTPTFESRFNMNDAFALTPAGVIVIAYIEMMVAENMSVEDICESLNITTDEFRVLYAIADSSGTLDVIQDMKIDDIINGEK